MNLTNLITPTLLHWGIGALCSAVLSGIVMYVKATYRAATNCVPTIARNTTDMKEELHELIIWLRTKVEDGRL